MSKKVKALTFGESEALVERIASEMAKGNQISRNTKYYCIILLMLDAGLRIGEVVRLQRLDLIFENQPVRSLMLGPGIAEKGCTRTIPTSERLKLAIEALKDFVWEEENAIFEGLSTLAKASAKYPAFCSPRFPTPLTVRQIQRTVKQLGKLSTGRDITPHMLRHTFATRMMRVANIRVVQELLGHKSINSTQIYTHPDSADLEAAINTITSNNRKGVLV